VAAPFASACPSKHIDVTRVGRTLRRVLNSTATTDEGSYSRCMSPQSIHEPAVDQGFEDRWAAWQARGDANDRATKRKLFMMAALLILSAAILTGVSLLR
jgi:hypothetical protein